MKTIELHKDSAYIIFDDMAEAALAYYAIASGKIKTALKWRLNWRELYIDTFASTTEIMTDSLIIQDWMKENDNKVIR